MNNINNLFDTIHPVCLELINLPSSEKVKQLYLLLSSQIHTLSTNDRQNNNNEFVATGSGNLCVFLDALLADYLFLIMTNLLNTGFNNEMNTSNNNKDSINLSIDENHVGYEYIFKIINILIDRSYKFQFNILLIKMFPLIPYILSSDIETKDANQNKDLNLRHPEFIKATLRCSLSLLEAIVKNDEAKKFNYSCQNSLSHFVNLNLSNIVLSSDSESSILSITILRITVFQIINNLKISLLIFPGVVSKLFKLIIKDIDAIKKNKVDKYIEVLRFLGNFFNFCLKDDNVFPDDQIIPKINENLNIFFKSLLQKITHSIVLAKLSSHIKKMILDIISNILLFNCSTNFSKDNILILSKIVIFLTSNNSELQSLYKLPKPSFYDATILSLIENESKSFLYSANQLDITLKINAICLNLQNFSLNTKDYKGIQNYKEIEIKTFGFIQQIIEELMILINSEAKQKNYLKNHESTLKISDLENIVTDLSISKSSTPNRLHLRWNKLNKGPNNNNNNNNMSIFESNLSMLLKRTHTLSEPRSLVESLASKKDLCLFDGIFEYEVEVSLRNLFKEIGKISSYKLNLNLLQTVLLRQGNSNLNKSILLWICNCIIEGLLELKLQKEYQRIEFNEFVHFDDMEEKSMNKDNEDEIRVTEIILDMLEISNNLLSISDDDNSSQLINCISLDTISVSSQFFKEDFDQELADYLFPVIEKLSASSVYPSSKVFKHSENALFEILKNVYNDQSGNLSTIILNNSDYLLDNINLKLMNGALLPDTLKILIVLIKISGINIINHMGDVINSSFILLDMYSEYSALSNGIFAMFNEILNSVYDKYLKNQYDFEKNIFEVHLKEAQNLQKPWNIQLSGDMFNLLDNSKKDITDIMKDQQNRSQEVDSDDEDEDSDDKTQIDIHEDTVDDVFKYKSHIPKNLYLIVQQIVSYSIRFLQYESFSLKNRIFNIINKSLMILCTQLAELNPILYQLWPLVLDAATIEQDIKVNIMALETIYAMFKFGGSFLAKSFYQFWDLLVNENKNFKNYSKKLLFAKQRVKEKKISKAKDEFKHSLELEYFENINKLLFLILKSSLGYSLSVKLAKQIINIGCTIDSAFLEEEFGPNSDIAWYLIN